MNNAAMRKRSSKRKRDTSREDESHAPKKVVKKQYRKICCADGCTNIAQRGGVCTRHEQRQNYAVVKDAPIDLRKEECALGTMHVGIHSF